MLVEDTLTGIPLPGAFENFQVAAHAAMDHLKSITSLGTWILAGVHDDEAVVLHVAGKGAIAQGDVLPWLETMAQRMTARSGPQIAPNILEVPAYATAVDRHKFGIAAFMGLPLLRSDRTLFGVIFGFDTRPQPAALSGLLPQVELISSLLATVLESELNAAEASRRGAQAEARALADPSTGLFNRTAFEQFVEQEEERCTRSGNRASAFVFVIEGQNGELSELEASKVAGIMRSAVRRQDFLARVDVGQFAILALDGSSAERLRIKGHIASALEQQGFGVKVGFALRSPASGIIAAWRLAEKMALAS